MEPVLVSLAVLILAIAAIVGLRALSSKLEARGQRRFHAQRVAELRDHWAENHVALGEQLRLEIGPIDAAELRAVWVKITNLIATVPETHVNRELLTLLVADVRRESAASTD
jgi:hypothetical protein